MIKNLYLTFVDFLKNNKKINDWTEGLIVRSKPLVERWIRLTSREKQLIIVLISAGAACILFSIIGSAIDISTRLNNKSIALQTYSLDVQSMKNQFKELSAVTANQFSDISLTRIQGDVTQALHVSTPDVTLQDNLLIIKADNVLFESAILLLEQLRKSYGIFPSKLKITQSRSGYVNFNATFLVSQ